MKTNFNINSFFGSNEFTNYYITLIIVFVIGLFIPLKSVILLSIFFIYLSLSLIDFIIYNNDFNQSELYLKISEIKYNSSMRSLSIVMSNENLLSGEELFKGIYNTIRSNNEFIKFGFQKIIILSCILENSQEVNLHSNVLISNETSFIEYYNSIINDLISYTNLEYGYQNLNIITFTIKTWNCSNLSNLNIKITHNLANKVK